VRVFPKAGQAEYPTSVNLWSNVPTADKLEWVAKRFIGMDRAARMVGRSSNAMVGGNRRLANK